MSYLAVVYMALQTHKQLSIEINGRLCEHNV